MGASADVHDAFSLHSGERYRTDLLPVFKHRAANRAALTGIEPLRKRRYRFCGLCFNNPVFGFHYSAEQERKPEGEEDYTEENEQHYQNICLH
jgi:hypothetical protein